MQVNVYNSYKEALELSESFKKIVALTKKKKKTKVKK